MKLSFLFEILLILIIIAFAASKPVEEGDAKVVNAVDSELAKQSTSDNVQKPPSDDDDDDIFGFGTGDDDDENDDSDDPVSDILGLDDEDDEKNDGTNAVASSDEEFDEFVIFGEDIFASIFEDDDDTKKLPNATTASPIVSTTPEPVVTQKPIVVKKPEVAAILEDTPAENSAEVSVETVPIISDVDNTNETKDEVDIIANLPPAPENIMNANKDVEITTVPLTDDSDEDEGLIVVSDDTQKLAAMQSTTTPTAESTNDSKLTMGNHPDMNHDAFQAEDISVIPQSIPTISSTITPIIEQHDAISVPPPKIVTTKKPKKDDEDEELLEIVQELISDEDDSDLLTAIENDNEDYKEESVVENNKDSDEDFEGESDGNKNTISHSKMKDKSRKTYNYKKWKLISRH